MRDHAPLPSFAQLFGSQPEVAADAPGRVNLIGEHTDYHEGFVLPTVVPQCTRVDLRRKSGKLVRAWSTNIAGDAVGFEIGAEARRDAWIDYVQGVTSALLRSGIDVTGFDARIDSTVPLGSGLSSSAA